MKKSSREKLNLFFSAFLVIGYIVCAYFFMTLTSNMKDGVGNLISAGVFVLFGLIVFYATRVGEGVPVKRFSPIVLFVLDLPALLIILAALLPAFPLHNILVDADAVWMLAAIALGYGIPFAFLSGFELIEEVEEEEELNVVVEGGIAQELSAAEETVEETEEVAEEVADEQDVKELEALDGAEAE